MTKQSLQQVLKTNYNNILRQRRDAFIEKSERLLGSVFSNRLALEGTVIEIDNNLIQSDENTCRPNLQRQIGGITSVNLIGCQGVTSWSGYFFNGGINAERGVNPQKAVANLLPLDTQNVAKRVTFLLGDNFYSNGLGHSNSNRFRTYNVENSNTFKANFTDLPYGRSYAILGNHDYGIWSNGGAQDSIYKIGLAHNQIKMDYSVTRQSNNWNMPDRYYCIFTEFADIYFIDSSTFVYDEQQKSWLDQNITAQKAKAGRKHQILVSHHPLLSIGKRSPYADKAERDEYKYSRYFDPKNDYIKNKRSKTAGSLNKALHGALAKYCFDVIISAHDHHLAAYDLLNKNESTTLQIVSGGGGASLEKVKPNNYTSLLEGTRIEPGCNRRYAVIRENDSYKPSRILGGTCGLFVKDKHGYARMEISKDSIEFTFRWYEGPATRHQDGDNGIATHIITRRRDA
jgi:hypothetical protein